MAFGKRWIIEDGAEEVIQAAAQTHDALPNMDQLGGAGADGMDPQQAVVFAMKD